MQQSLSIGMLHTVSSYCFTQAVSFRLTGYFVATTSCNEVSLRMELRKTKIKKALTTVNAFGFKNNSILRS